MKFAGCSVYVDSGKTVLERTVFDKTELDPAELATLELVSWFNHHRLLEAIGYIPPAEAEANYYQERAMTADAI